MTDWMTGAASQPAVIGAASLAALVVFALSVWALLRRRRPAEGERRDARDVLLNVAVWLVSGVSGYLAAQGQVDFAEWAGVADWRKYLVPVILEPAVAALLLLANRRAERLANGLPARSPRPLLWLAGLLAGFAIYTNVVHAGSRAGLIFGAASAVALTLMWVKLRDKSNPGAVDLDDVQQAESARVSRRTARYRWLRWLFFPRQTHKAWRISLGYSVADAERGLDLARLWVRELDAARERAGDPWPLRAAWWRARRVANEAVRVAVLTSRPGSPTPVAEPVDQPAAPPVPPRVKVARTPAPPAPGVWWRDLVDLTAPRAEQMRAILYHAIRLDREVPRAAELDRMVTPPAKDYARQNYRTWLADAREQVTRERAGQRNGHDLAGVR